MSPALAPAADREQALRDWTGRVTTLLDQAEAWAARAGWACRSDPKPAAEEALGAYEVPVLLIHTPQGRLLLDPIARNVVGADGRVDFCALPSYDSYAVVGTGGGWRVYPPERDAAGLAWSEETFLATAAELLARR